MTPVQELEELIKTREAKLAAEVATRTSPTPENAEPKKEPTGGRQCQVHAHRDAVTGQFYALSKPDRIAFDLHCAGITDDLKPSTNRERWLASSIAEDQWRLSRARAIENNIFAIGMSGAIADATHADSPEVLAAVCQARVWLADGKHIQALSLYEHRLLRNVERNEKQIKLLQAERNAARDQAFEEELLLAELALSEGETYNPSESLGFNNGAVYPTYSDDTIPGTDAATGHGFGFSIPEILRLASRRLRLRKARHLYNPAPHRTKRTGPTPIRAIKAA